jgi:hypothetical protein
MQCSTKTSESFDQTITVFCESQADVTSAVVILVETAGSNSSADWKYIGRQAGTQAWFACQQL